MGAPGDSSTNIHLLGRLRDPNDRQAWGEFVLHYGPRLYSWSKGRMLQDADAEDLTQEVLKKVWKGLFSFQYDPSRSFRAWLRTVWQHAWIDYLKKRGRHPDRGTGDTKVLVDLGNVEDGTDVVASLEEAFNQEILEEAQARVRLRVARETWEAFRLMVLEEVQAREAADLLGLTVRAVYSARYNVARMLREEFLRLSPPDSP
jgi:RNA polymerase sigma-70 factor (ECF subfamily)